MEVKVNVTVELGEKTMAVLAGLVGVSAKVAVPVKELKKVEDPAPDESTDDAEKEKTPARSRTSRKAAEEEKPKTRSRASKKDAGVDFADLDEDAKLEAIRALVTRNTKKGNSADIKEILSSFDAGRAGDIAVEDYTEAYDAFKRYDAGESLDEILPE